MNASRANGSATPSRARRSSDSRAPPPTRCRPRNKPPRAVSPVDTRGSGRARRPRGRSSRRPSRPR
ncbi:MAG: hypothetical protein FJ386_07860 [Verrucomicrobia bacterium]|nr:hypothetical protein [Verrucomicrobiota bacterium]